MVKIYFGDILKLEHKKIIVPIYIDTKGNNINTFEIKLEFKGLKFRDYLENDSIISFWLEKPYIDKDKVILSGITPGGYIGKKGLLINLVFETEDKGYLKILESSQVFLNDGIGTKLEIKTSEIKILPTQEHRIFKSKDSYPPERFKIYLNRDPEIFDNKYHLIFEANDKQSGIAYYEIAEKQSFIKPKIESLIFRKSESPYIINDQSLRSYIFVKAVDKFGNERIEYLEPQIYLEVNEIFFIFLSLIIIFATFNFLNRKLKR
ncbi:MAG: hypothetical protein NZ866_02875 [Patescibacteria group bacterium]|nr:hypothetical protein [Patescibacteria group bacterium]